MEVIVIDKKISKVIKVVHMFHFYIEVDNGRKVVNVLLLVGVENTTVNILLGTKVVIQILHH